MTHVPLILALMTLSSPAFAHATAAEGAFASGLTHPVFGLDHGLTMLMVGIWAAMLGGRSLWVLPLGFVSVMGLGYGAATLGLQVPMIEPMILVSLLVLGFVVSHALRIRAAAAGIVVAGFAFFHGAAHGVEHTGSDALSFGFGFAVSSAGLLFGGLVLAFACRRACGARAVKLTGVIAAVAGVLAMTAG